MKELRSAEWDLLLFFSLYITCVFPLALSLYLSLPLVLWLLSCTSVSGGLCFGEHLSTPGLSLSRNVAFLVVGSEVSNHEGSSAYQKHAGTFMRLWPSLAKFGEHWSPCRKTGEAKVNRQRKCPKTSNK